MLRTSFTSPFLSSAAGRLAVAMRGEAWRKPLVLLVWGVVAYSAVTWVLRSAAVGSHLSDAAPAAQAQAMVDTSAVLRSLGAMPAAPAATPSVGSRFKLMGVLTGGPDEGAALIAVDGKTAKPYRVGATVVDGMVVQSAQGRSVSLGSDRDGPAVLTLELPVKK